MTARNSVLFFFFFLAMNSSAQAMHEINQTGEAHKNFVSMEAVQAMCKAVYEQAIEGNFTPELIIGLSRGGLVPLCFLAGEGNFNNRHVKTISVASYSDHGKRGQLKLLAPWGRQDFAYLKQFSSILIVDDLVDSGKSISFVVDLVKKHAPYATVKTAALFYKRCSIIKPDYYAQETLDWIVFPWEW